MHPSMTLMTSRVLQFPHGRRSAMMDERSGVEGPTGGGASRRWTWGSKHRLETDPWSLEGDRTLHCTPKVSPAVATLRHSSGAPGRRSWGSPCIGYRLETDRGCDDAGRPLSLIKRHALLERNDGSSILNKIVEKFRKTENLCPTVMMSSCQQAIRLHSCKRDAEQHR